MSLLKDIATLGQLPALLRLKKGMTPRPEDVKDCFGARQDRFRGRHDRVGGRPKQ